MIEPIHRWSHQTLSYSVDKGSMSAKEAIYHATAILKRNLNSIGFLEFSMWLKRTLPKVDWADPKTVRTGTGLYWSSLDDCLAHIDRETGHLLEVASWFKANIHKPEAIFGLEAMTPAERVAHYAAASGYPQGLFVGDDGRIAGSWIMGNNYTVRSGLYGGYPHGYLRRIKALFPDKSSVLHLFSGEVDQSIMPGKTVDINPTRNPDYLDDAQSLATVPLETFDLVLADPPYSHEDAEKYGVTLIKAAKVMKALERVKTGTHIVWLDQRLPMYRKECFRTVAYIGMVKSTNHRFRVVTIFERV